MLKELIKHPVALFIAIALHVLIALVFIMSLSLSEKPVVSNAANSVPVRIISASELAASKQTPKQPTKAVEKPARSTSLSSLPQETLQRLAEQENKIKQQEEKLAALPQQATAPLVKTIPATLLAANTAANMVQAQKTHKNKPLVEKKPKEPKKEQISNTEAKQTVQTPPKKEKAVSKKTAKKKAQKKIKKKARKKPAKKRTKKRKKAKKTARKKKSKSKKRSNKKIKKSQKKTKKKKTSKAELAKKAEAKKKAAQKAAAAKKAKEQAAKKAAAEKKAKQEAARKAWAAKKAKEDAQKRAAAEQRRKEAEAKKRAEAAARQKADAKAKRIAGLNWAKKVRRKVKGRWHAPPGSGGMKARVRLKVSRSGQIRSLKIVKCNGTTSFCRSIKTAFERSVPLPRLSRNDLFDEHLNFTFRR
jgi:colicin import membrane protein